MRQKYESGFCLREMNQKQNIIRAKYFKAKYYQSKILLKQNIPKKFILQKFDTVSVFLRCHAWLAPMSLRLLSIRIEDVCFGRKFSFTHIRGGFLMIILQRRLCPCRVKHRTAKGGTQQAIRVMRAGF